MNAAQVTATLERLTGEFELELDDDERRIWTEALSEYPVEAAADALDRLMDVVIDRPSVADFRGAARGARSAPTAPPRRACSCMNGWEMPDESNYVVACHSCEEGRIRGDATERYRSDRAQLRRRIHGPALLTEKPATDIAGWLRHARGAEAPEVHAGHDLATSASTADLDF